MFLGSGSTINRGRNLHAIDTRFGPCVHPSGSGSSELYDSFSYSELEDNEDCPQGSKCDHCIARTGLILPLGGGHKDIVPKYSKFPLFGGAGTMGAYGRIYRHTFIGYKDKKTTCGSTQRAVMPSLNPDYTPFVEFFSPKFVDQSLGAMSFIQNPPKGWANPEDCVEFPCTGPYNIVMRFEDAQFTGLKPGLPKTFDIISNNIESTSAQVIPTCNLNTDWNAWLCLDDNIGVMIFDSQDGDRMDRSVQPVYI